ncbi:fimbrial protein [Citrobacter freundii]|nr:fimbrial protein [Citrobacter freundii]
MIQKILLLLSLLLATTQSAWAGCYIELGNSSSSSGLTTTDLNITAVAQTPLPNSTDIMKTSGNSTFTYWVDADGKGNAGDAGSLTFTPAGTTFTVDSGNKKGWLADASIPGLYFTLEAVLPKPPQGPFNSWNKTTIYLSNDANLNKATASGWGCSSTNEMKMENATVTFNLSFYTTSAFDPAKASGKKLFSSRQQVGVLQNKTDMGGEIDVYINGPLTIATIGCAAFQVDTETVNLGEINISELKRNPDPAYNNTPFNIKLENCYTTPDLVLNFSGNQTKRIDSYTTTLVNTQGTSKGVGVALQYLTSQGSTDIGFNLDVTQPSTVPATFLNYANGNGTLRMRAQLYVNDVNALAPGTLFIPAVMTITHP